MKVLMDVKYRDRSYFRRQNFKNRWKMVWGQNGSYSGVKPFIYLKIIYCHPEINLRRFIFIVSQRGNVWCQPCSGNRFTESNCYATRQFGGAKTRVKLQICGSVDQRK